MVITFLVAESEPRRVANRAPFRDDHLGHAKLTLNGARSLCTAMQRRNGHSAALQFHSSSALSPTRPASSGVWLRPPWIRKTADHIKGNPV